MSQTANTLRESALIWQRIVLPPSGVEVIRNLTGRHFQIIEHSGGLGEKFFAAFNDKPFFKAALGLKYVLPPGDAFSKLRFRNDTAEEMVIEIYAGTVETEDMRLNIVRGRATPMMEAESVITGHSQTILAAAEVDLSATTPPGPRFIRKATIVTNMDPAVDLDLANVDDDVFAAVFPKQSHLVQSSDPVKVQNPSGAPIVARIAQLWYVIN